ncbi:T9SS type A sorting domain-containing protein [Flavobacterium sp.]
MKRLFTTMLFLCIITIGYSQTTNVSYSVSTENFSNPERGFYHHKETSSTNYSALTQSSLSNYRTNEKITLILRLFYLEDFINAPISQAYLNNVQNDFNKIRNAGIKCIVRFAYSSETTVGQRDANKAQILSHIQQLSNLLRDNGDIIATVQAGFIGTWGEWYYTDHFGMNPTNTDYVNRKQILEAILGAIPTDRTVQIRTPRYKQKMFNTAIAINQVQVENRLNIGRVGHHNDCFLSDASDVGTYINTATEYPYLSQETTYLPMGGETCDFDPNRSNCDVGTSEMALFHWSYMNMDYYPEVIDEFNESNCLSDIKKKLGYRFEFTKNTFPNSITAGGIMPVTLRLINSGFASIYNPRVGYIILKNIVSGQQYSLPINSKPQFWTGANEITINENLVLPTTMAPGNYKLYFNLPDSAPSLNTRPEYSIRFANQDTWDNTTGYNDLKYTINVGQALAISDNVRINPVIYPNPANQELVIELENISDYKATLFNVLGQNFGVVSNQVGSDKLVLNTESLSNGVYLLKLENGTISTTKRIIIKH